MKQRDIVAVTFLDHVESSKVSKAERFTVYGRLIKADSRCVIVASWAYTNARRKCDHNTTTYTILRSCIERLDILTPSE
tara:strand:- start:230 stop:466 length:237 start_codon:yes stop_codon:yes gene_type:complete